MARWSSIILIISLILFLPLRARAETSVGIGNDVVHSTDTYAFILRHDFREYRIGTSFMYWNGSEGPDGAVTAEYIIGKKRFNLNLGAAYIFERSDLNGTHFNYSLGASWCPGKHLRLQFTHFSNGHNKYNVGWNFVGVLYRF